MTERRFIGVEKSSNHGITTPRLRVVITLFFLLITTTSTLPVSAQFDIGHTEPDNTQLQFVTSGGGAVEDVEVVGTTAYAAIGRRLVVLDVSDETNPIEIGSLDMGVRVLDLELLDGFAVVVTEEGVEDYPLSIVDISMPTRLKRIWN